MNPNLQQSSKLGAADPLWHYLGLLDKYFANFDSWYEVHRSLNYEQLGYAAKYLMSFSLHIHTEKIEEKEANLILENAVKEVREWLKENNEPILANAVDHMLVMLPARGAQVVTSYILINLKLIKEKEPEQTRRKYHTMNSPVNDPDD